MRHPNEPLARSPNLTRQAGVLTRPRTAEVQAATSSDQGRKLLLVDDDILLRQRMTRALEPYGIAVIHTGDRTTALQLAQEIRPELAVIELCVNDNNSIKWSGLDLLSRFLTIHRKMRVTMLTSYGSIATAVTAIQLGAENYLSKPIDVGEIANALLQTGPSNWSPPKRPMSADRLRWEHIQRIFHQCGFNVSETARRLRMHRRSLQRTLAKRAPPE